MKVRPILFSAAMMRAHLAKRKTMTRRIAKPRGRPSLLDIKDASTPVWSDSYILDAGNAEWREADAPAAAGDIYYSREAWRAPKRWDAVRARDLGVRTMTISFEAGGHISNTGHPRDLRWEPGPESTTNQNWVGKLRPGIFQPRWASRLMMEVTEVRLERLQAITEAGAVAEGVAEYPCEGDARGPNATYWSADGTDPFAPIKRTTPIQAYRALWEEINGEDAWIDNPWVWVIAYKPTFQNVDIYLKDAA